MSQAGVAILAIGEAEGTLVAAIDQDPELTVVRRCADLAEVQAAIRAGVASVAVIDTQDPDLDAATVVDLKHSHAIVILLASLTQAAQFKVWGADGLAQPSAPASVVESIHAALRGQAMSGVAVPDEAEPPPASETEGSDPARGKMIAVWGTSGAPGRSSVALMLAASLSHECSTLLLDADTANPSLTTMLGWDSEMAGLGALARLAHRGQLTPPEITRAAALAGDHLNIIPGLTSAQRFRELSLMSLRQILTQASVCAQIVVVDCASGSGDPVETGTDHPPTTRDEQVAEVLRKADHVIMVGRGDVLGIERMERAFVWWKDLGLETSLTLVVNRVSTSTAGARPANAVAQSLLKIAAGQHVWVLPEDQHVASALLHGEIPHPTRNSVAATVVQLAHELLQADLRNGETPTSDTVPKAASKTTPKAGRRTRLKLRRLKPRH